MPHRPDLRSGDHLPKRRPDGQPPHPNWLPRQRRGITPQMIGRYPDYDVFDAEATWDEVTRGVVTERLYVRGPLRFFTAEEEPALRAFCDTVTAQDMEPRVPVAEMVDQKFAAGQLDGYRYADLPEDPETWRIALRGLDYSAGERFQRRFAELDVAERESIVGDFSEGKLYGGPWDGLNLSQVWSVVMRGVLSTFYSHPWTWNEIGFGGPAYPRGFMRLGQGVEVLEPFEKPGATDEDPVREAPELEQ
jgi:hypothetical protein